MDFEFTDEQDALRSAVRDLIGAHGTTLVPGDAVHTPQLWAALAGMGVLGLPFPEESGGMGAGPVEVLVVASELGRAGVRAAYPEAMMAGTLLGTDPLLEKLCDGSELVVQALYEPGRAFSPVPVGVQVSGDGLTGVREPIAFASAATKVVTPAADGDAVGIYVVEEPVFRGTRLDLDGAAVRRIEGDASTVQRAVNLGILTQAAEALGAMETALTMTVDYLKSRKQFGVPLMRFQTLSHRAADMYTSVELARSAVYYGAMTLAADPDSTAAMSRLRVIAGKAGRHVGQEAIQLHGGIGMTAEYAVGHHTARLTAIEHSLGDVRHHLALLSKHVGKYADVDLVG